MAARQSAFNKGGGQRPDSPGVGAANRRFHLADSLASIKEKKQKGQMVRGPEWRAN